MLTALVGVAFDVAVTAVVATVRRRRAAFRERFPPIPDAEFLARCSPGTRPDVALKVRRIMAEALAVEYERVYPNSRLVGDLGAE